MLLLTSQHTYTIVSIQTWPLMCQIRTLQMTVASRDTIKIRPVRSPLKNLMSMKVTTMWLRHSTLKSCSKRHSLVKAARVAKRLVLKGVQSAVLNSKVSLPVVIMQAARLSTDNIIRQSLEDSARKNHKTLMMLQLITAQALSKKWALALA